MIQLKHKIVIYNFLFLSSTGIDKDYILYGKGEDSKLQVRETLLDIIDKSDKEELKMYYKCISTIKSYVTKKDKNNG